MYRKSRIDAYTPPTHDEVSRTSSQLTHAERMEKIRMKRAQEQEDALKTLEEHELKRRQAELNRQKAIKERSLSAHSTMAKVEDAKKRKADIEAAKQRRFEEAQRRTESSHATTSHQQEKARVAFGTTGERDLAYLGVPKKYAMLNVPLRAAPLTKEEQDELKKSSPRTSREGIYERRQLRPHTNIAFGTSMTRSVHGAIAPMPPPRARSTATHAPQKTQQTPPTQSPVAKLRARSNAPMSRSMYGGLPGQTEQKVRSISSTRTPPVQRAVETKSARKPPLPPVQRQKQKADAARAQKPTPTTAAGEATVKIIRPKDVNKLNKAIKSPPSTPPDFKKAKPSDEQLPQSPIDALTQVQPQKKMISMQLLDFTEVPESPLQEIPSTHQQPDNHEPEIMDTQSTPVHDAERSLLDFTEDDDEPIAQVRRSPSPNPQPAFLDYTEALGDNLIVQMAPRDDAAQEREETDLVDINQSSANQFSPIIEQEPISEDESKEAPTLVHTPEQLLSGLLQSSRRSPKRSVRRIEEELQRIPEIHTPDMTIDDGVKDQSSSHNGDLSPAGTYTVSNASEGEDRANAIDSDMENRDSNETPRADAKSTVSKVASLAEMQINDEKFLLEKERRVQEIERKRIADELARQERLNKLRQTLARVDKTKTPDTVMTTSMHNGAGESPLLNGNMTQSMILPGQVDNLDKTPPRPGVESTYSTPLANPITPTQTTMATPASLYATPIGADGARPSILQSNPRLQALMKKHLKDAPPEKPQAMSLQVGTTNGVLAVHQEMTTPEKTPTSPMNQMSLEEELARANGVDFDVNHRFEDN